MRHVRSFVLAGVVALSLAVACGSSDESVFGTPGDDAGSTTTGEPSGPAPFGPGNGGDADTQDGPIHIEPADPVLTYVSGGAAPTTTFVAKTANGAIVPASFAIDRGEVGTLGVATGAFAATGNVGGKATITATFGARATTTSVTVKLKTIDNGSANGGIQDAGADSGANGTGGFGGVGGEGLGAAVDATALSTLKNAPTTDPNSAMLYPYDKTVWPRGILAPLLQWKPGDAGDYDAVLIRLQENDFEYEGTFAKTATPFIHHPIPQQAWKQMLSSNGGEDVTVTLVFSKGATTYGPLVTKWKVASAPLKGVVYYNSYGTKLAKNFTGAIPGNQTFGGATLGIRPGSTDPELVAGGNGNSSQCRVCHSVASNGSVLVTQRGLGGDRAFSTYDLKTGAETPMLPVGGGAGGQAKYSWPAIYPDGTMFLGDSSSADGSSNTPNLLYQVATGGAAVTPATVTTTGWPAGFRAAYPAFSPDGKKLAFTMFAGATGADQKTLGTMTFDKATGTWGPLEVLHKPANNLTALYPAFLPTNDAVIFHVETRYNTRDYGGTRSDADVAPTAGGNPTNDPARRGARAKLWWMDLATKTAVPLDNLNGKGHLPVDAANDHDDDETLNYEPTVNPVTSGGYAWVVFTSRRSYGNVATINPFFSDPRYNDLTSRPTTKKLWVAAIDLNAPPGTDPSHPAFYLPAQELLAGNSRGYWVVDPCKSDGNDCETGDECCGGFCRPDGANKLVCSNVVPACAQEFEKCTVTADCCGAPAKQCINGRCGVSTPR